MRLEMPFLNDIIRNIKVTLATFALIVLSSCSYGDDISSLDDRVTNIEEAVRSLKDAFNSGKIISSVAPIETDVGGYLISFSDGTTIKLNNGKDGEDASGGLEVKSGVTPMIGIDYEGYWAVSYNNGQSYLPITDKNGLPIYAIGIELCIRVGVKDGLYVFEIYSPNDPETVIESIETSYSPNPESILQSIIEDQDNSTITLTLADGTVFRFNLDVSFPSSIIMLTDHVSMSDKDMTATFEFRINPSNSFIYFVIEGENSNIRLERILTSRAGDADSYATAPTDCRITDISPSYNEHGERLTGQYTATIKSDAKDVDGEEIVALIITTKDGIGNRIQISSEIMSVAYDSHPQIYGINVGGFDAVRTDENTFYVKLPYGASVNEMVAEFSTNSIISVGDNRDIDILDLSNPVTITATLNGATRDYSLIAYYSNLPVIYINTPYPVTSKDDWVKKSTIQITNAGEYNAIYESAQLKGRGNTTWGYPKKPYAVKLDKKSEVLGMPKHKRWCLLANWMDRTNIRNDISLEIGRRLSGLEWTPRGRFVDVVFNGIFVGNYYLCEQIKIDSNRVNIDEMTDTDDNGYALTGGYLIELDANFDEVNKFRSSLLNLPVNFKDPDEDVLQTAQFEYMQKYFNDVEKKILDHEKYIEIESLIDIDSFIDWWVVNELVGNWEPNHPKSSYMYKKRNGKIYAGPAWDFDWGTFTGSTGWYNKGAIWYAYLFRYPEFVKRVKERWQVNRSVLATIPDYIQYISNEIEISSVYDCELWPIYITVNGDEQMSFTKSVERLRQNYLNRFKWIDENISSLQ